MNKPFKTGSAPPASKHMSMYSAPCCPPSETIGSSMPGPKQTVNQTPDLVAHSTSPGEIPVRPNAVGV